MNAFHDQDILLVQLHEITLEILSSLHEIKSWNLHSFTLKEFVKLSSE